MVEAKETKTPNINKFEFHCIRLYNATTATVPTNLSVKILLRDFRDVLRDALTGLPPVWPVEQCIELLGSMPKPACCKMSYFLFLLGNFIFG